MKWLLVNSKTSLLQEYRLLDGGKNLVIIKYNPVHRSARISCNGTQRLFFIESTGALTGKYIFRNEYDMEIGHMHYDKWFGKEGQVTIETQKYDYKITGASSPQLMIRDEQSGRSMSCEVEIENESNGNLASQSSKVENNFLLLGLCWYMFLPVAKKNLVEHAA